MKTDPPKRRRKDRRIVAAILWVVGGVLRLVSALLDLGR
jgi:hypothetical protein